MAGFESRTHVSGTWRFGPQHVVVLLCSVVAGCAPVQPRAPSSVGPPLAVQGDLSSDRRVAWLRTHAIPVRAVDPADDDFSDLQPFRQVIGNARIVLLGEQTHDDGITFLAKTRLIKFLHQEMGFDVLTWESGLYEVAKAWELIEGGADPATAMRRAISPAWTNVEETRALFEYIGAVARTTRPLAVAGFDCQFTGTISRDFLVSDLRAFLQKIGLDTTIVNAGTPLAVGLDAMVANTSRRRVADLVAPDSVFVDALSELQQRVASAAAPDRSGRRAFWAQLLTSLRQEALKLRAQLDSHDSTATREERESAFRRQWNLRDAQMTENLLWLAREGYPGRKIIGWAATAHAARSPDDVDTRMPDDPRRGTTPMGQWMWEALGQELYVLGFTAYDLAAFEQAPNSDQSEEVEFEELMHAAGLEFAIVDFRRLPPGGEWLREPIISRPMANWGMKARWPRVLDGMFYMREWRPATRTGH
jgi:erythromycin esterase